MRFTGLYAEHNATRLYTNLKKTQYGANFASWQGFH